VATSYLIVIADQMPTVMAQAGAAPRWQARELWVSLGVAIAGPLACASRLEALKLSSVLAICCVLYVALLSAVVLAFPDELACAAGAPPGSCRGTVRSAPKVLSIFIFGFTCQQNLFAVVNELARPTLGRVNRVIGAAVPLALGVYLLVALSGYLVYGTAVQPDLLLNYPADSACFLCARAGISIVVLCAYPLQAHPSRKCALTLLASIERACAQARAQAPRADARRDGLTASGTAAIGSLEATSDVRIPAVCIEEDALAKPLLSTSAPFGVAGDAAERTAGATSDRGDAPGDSGEARDWEYSWRYWVYTGLFVLCSWRIALAVHSLGTVMAVVGATGSTSVSYILPGAIYCKLHPHPHAKRNAALCMCAAGVCIIPVALHAIFTR
jgi:amino acid permease